MKGNYKEIHKDYFLMNGQVLNSEEFEPVEIIESTSVYEVIRIIEGVPLFLEEHLARLQKSLALLNSSVTIDTIDIEKQIHQLIKINRCYDYNMKLIINNLSSPAPNIFLFFISSKYPSQEEYKEGVATILYAAERKNPNIKVLLKDFRQNIEGKLRKVNAYEAILVNQDQEITEGSRSNIFFVKEDILYTSPAEKVLKGVTRNRIFKLCKSQGIPVVETPISIDFLKECDGLFISSTPFKILPISTVGNDSYNSAINPIVLKVMEAYDNLIKNYINAKKKI